MSDRPEAMNLLNEIAGRFPEAISLAAGRPMDRFVEVHAIDTQLERFASWWSTQYNRPAEAARILMGQYSDTNGIIRTLLAQYLRTDEGLDVTPAACMVTNGAQEAIAIALLGLCVGGQYVAAQDPTYVGLTGAADALRLPFRSIPHDADLMATLRCWARAEAGPSRGRMGVFYCVPDFSNPSAQVMDLATRRALVELAAEGNFYIIEDAAYRRYRYEGEDLPTLKSLDRNGRVIYIESFAKTVLPALRLAVMVADEQDAEGRTLADRLSSIKSYVSVATSPIAQATLGGILISTDFSLRDWTQTRREACGRNRDMLVAALATHFADLPDVSWTSPTGGFFLTLRLPFAFGTDEMATCAREAGVIVVPVSVFSSGNAFNRQVRLAFSNATEEHLELGIARLAAYVRSRLPDGLRGRARPPPSSAALQSSKMEASQ